jgi:Cation efflux family/HWE histidine kinase
MSDIPLSTHDHFFLGEAHEKNERRTWVVIGLCTFMMVVEVVGGLLVGSIALVADGLHMSTHASALLLAALTYRYARHYADDARFSFGTGKLGDLAGFTSAIILAMIALLIGYEAMTRLISPVPIHYTEAIPIAVLGLIVNVASMLLLSGGGHDHRHSHGHAHLHDDHEHDQVHSVRSSAGLVILEIFAEGMPPRFKLSFAEKTPAEDKVTIETVRADGARQGLAYFEGTSPERQVTGFVGTLADITERKEREEREHLLVREINHRAKNMLCVVTAIAHQTTTKRPEDFIERFSERIRALSANQDLLVRNEWRGVDAKRSGARSTCAVR